MNIVSKIKTNLIKLISYPVVIFILVTATLTPLTLLPSHPAKAQSLPAYNYTKTFDTTNGSASGLDVATDSSGDVYVTGTFNGTVVFDGVGGHDSQTDPGGGNVDTFLTKYNANGSYGYTKIFDNSASGTSAYGNGVATDSNGNVYVTGYFAGTVVFDGVGGRDSQTTTNNPNSFLVKYSPNGSYGYTKVFDATNGGANGYGVATDSNGNVYVTGFFYST
ncbi:MAG TPA: SBBP repeat-containing protein, partial [Candidatus Saccharimonadales bacterium]